MTHKPADETFDAATLKREFPGLADPGLHYLDNAATAQMPEAALAAMRSFEVEARANVHGGVHRRARAAMAAYDRARARAARFLHAESPGEIVFTCGATSALNLLAFSFGERLKPGDEVLLSVLEHHSNLVPWQQLAARRGVSLRFLPVTTDGRLDLHALKDELTGRCRLVALTHCSNVTGAVTDIRRVAAAASTVGARLLVDGAQMAPHGPLDVRALGADFYVFSGHKTFGPTGIGVLWGRGELLADLPPFMTGGQMIEHVALDHATFRPAPRRFEAGTPPIAAAVGLGAALAWMEELDWPAARRHESRLTSRLLDGLSLLPRVRVLGPTDTRDRRGVVSFQVEGFLSDEVCSALDVRGVALRGGFHCAEPGVRALGSDGAVRASLAPYNGDTDVDALLEGLDRLLAVRLERRRIAPQRRAAARPGA